MNSINYDEQIKQIENKINKLKDEMEVVTKEFLDKTKIFACEWYKKSIEDAVIKSPEITKSLGESKLKELKIELQSLIDNSNEYVNFFVNSDSLWTHRPNYQLKGKETYGLYRVYGNRDPDELSDAIRFLIGKVGALLHKYNYEKPNNNFYENDYSSGNFRFRYGYSWSDDMRSVINNYADLFDNHKKLNEELEKIKKEKSEDEARALWNNV